MSWGATAAGGLSTPFPERAADVFVLGPYQTATGGCDRIQHYERIPPLIQNPAARGHVIFEGVIVSSTYGQVGALLQRWGKQAVMLTLDTPLEECVRRVNVRRGPRGAPSRKRFINRKCPALGCAAKAGRASGVRCQVERHDNQNGVEPS